MSINKVAQLAGVSVATVSRVLNRRPRVAAGTLENVRRAMSELGYAPSDRRPGPKANAYATTNARNIAFLIFGTMTNRATPAFQDLLYGVSTTASVNGTSLTLRHIADPDVKSGAFDGPLDGVILYGDVPSEAVREQLAGLPTVWLMGDHRRPAWGDQVVPDADGIGELAATYLLAQGHRQLAFLNLHMGLSLFDMCHNAFASTARDAGASIVDLQRTASAETPYWHRDGHAEVDALVDRFCKLDPMPTGLFVPADIQVAVLQPALQARGVQFGPGRVDVVSCNNERPYLAGLSPQPAEIDVRPSLIGRRGVEQLLWRLEHRSAPEQVIVAMAPQLIEPRASAQPDGHTTPGLHLCP